MLKKKNLFLFKKQGIFSSVSCLRKNTAFWISLVNRYRFSSFVLLIDGSVGFQWVNALKIVHFEVREPEQLSRCSDDLAELTTGKM